MMNNQSAPLIFGEVLYDCFPDGTRVLGGAPFNVAWHCQAFGLSPLLISRVGDDQMGEQIALAMQNWGMDTSGLQFDKQHPTGIVDVAFNNGEPSYDIVENSAWDFIDHTALPSLDNSDVLYHGSLALRNTISASALQYIKQMTSASVFVDINLRAPWWNNALIEEIIEQGRWLKLNEEELSLIVPHHATTETRIDDLLSTRLLNLLIVTRGEKGVIVASADGNRVSVEPERNLNVVDTVGAGDAFSSVMLLAQYKAWPLQIALNRAQAFASAIVGIRGATINDLAFYQPFVDGWQLKS
ncbi:MAG: carbohydrate kinase [Gammaproteobacteria bacterium]|nr:carbohydrate kinase [Gammaproteobacteria bacterium]MDH5736601.1 carbohydrate kinase [Gammaproteobacteria bacterium]